MATIQDTLILNDQYSPALNNYIQSLLRAQNAANQTQNANRHFSDSASEAARSTNSFVSSLRNLAGAYVGVRGLSSLFNLSDTISQTTARLDSMGDKFDITMDQIYGSAQRARGSLMGTADMVSKLGNLAGEAFNSSQELVDFAEQLNKQITLSGASTVAADAAMLQLTQAMSSGVLRGEELNSILEQTPTIAKTIADYMGVSTGQMREMASEGQVTAEVVKNALLGAADEVNAKFEQMPMTWGQVWTSFKNTAIMAVRPVLTAINWMANNIQIIGPLVLGAAGAFAVFQIAAHWTTIATAATAAYHFVVNLLTIGYGVLTGNAGAASAAVFAFNSALLASPITWVVMGVILLVGALYAGVAAYNKLTDSSVSATGIIAGAFYVLGSFVLNSTIIPLQRGFASFANFIGNVFNDPVTAVKVLFYDMSITVIGYIQSLVGGIEDLINAIPGVEVNLTSGIDSLYNRLQSSRQAAISAGSYKESNPHSVTAAQVGADPAGSAAAVQSSLSAHTGNRSNPHGVTAQQVGADPAGTAAAVQQALASQIAVLTTQMGGKVSFQTGTYSGTGDSTNILNLPVTPKVLIIMINPKSDWTESVQIPLVAICPGYYLTQTTTISGASMSYLQVKEFGATVKIKSDYDSNAYNEKGKTYTWVALY